MNNIVFMNYHLEIHPTSLMVLNEQLTQNKHFNIPLNAPSIGKKEDGPA